jgi:cysteinyl-tRNA synthetase
MQLRLYNTLTRQIDPFVPLDEPGRRVSFYTCGPTVYDYAHIGNFRSFLNADLLRRTLELLDYTVQHVMNLTDVGHMTDDEVADGGGEDKMEAAARRLKNAKKSGELPASAQGMDANDPYAIADFYAEAFMEDARTLGMKVAFEALEHPELTPRPTQYIPQMVDLVERVIAAGHAYRADDGVVYFDVQSFPEYGALSGNTPEELRSGQGGRVDAATQAMKRHPADFMLWKPDPTHLMRWESPWGEGYPGWHLECSVMAAQLLAADTNGVIDIHSGGEDNIFPHHECEIAQTCAASGETHFARYWFHTRHLMFERGKMSKSKGTFFTPRDLFKRGASPAAVRLELTKTHYRSNASFSLQGLSESERRIERWRHWIGQLAGAPADAPQDAAIDTQLQEIRTAFISALVSDLNVSGALATIDQLVRIDVASLSGEQLGAARHLMAQMIVTLGVAHPALDAQRPEIMNDDWFLPAVQVEHGDEATIAEKLLQREAAREAKDWGTSDRLRDELLKMGVAVKDSADGTTWTRIVE